jgi:uncharacterized protein YbjT (DUF2867 family)
MRVAIAGGTGRTGGHVAAALAAAGHEPVVLSRAAGVDLLTGTGLDAALAGAGALVDCSNFPAQDAASAERQFGAAMRNLLEASRRTGVRHQVLLSIVNVDRLHWSPHYAGKRLQERMLADGGVPYTIVRATQFHEFAAMMVDAVRRESEVPLPPLLLQPVDTTEVGAALAARAVGPALGTVEDVAGPERITLTDMARRYLAACRDSAKVIEQPLSPERAGESFVPGPGARIMQRSFEDWLQSIGRRGAAG